MEDRTLSSQLWSSGVMDGDGCVSLFPGSWEELCPWSLKLILKLIGSRTSLSVPLDPLPSFHGRAES